MCRMQAIFAALQLSIFNSAEPIATLFWGIALVLLSSRLRASRVNVNERPGADVVVPAPGRFAAGPAGLARTFTAL